MSDIIQTFCIIKHVVYRPLASAPDAGNILREMNTPVARAPM